MFWSLNLSRIFQVCILMHLRIKRISKLLVDNTFTCATHIHINILAAQMHSLMATANCQSQWAPLRKEKKGLRNIKVLSQIQI